MISADTLVSTGLSVPPSGSFTEGIAEHLVADVIWLALASIIAARLVLEVAAWPSLVMALRRRGSKIRFSAAAILRARDGDQYALVYTPARGRRGPYWAPLGGVLKCRHDAVANLLVDLEPDWLADGTDDMGRDLRVKMRGARFWRFMRWYWRGDGREAPASALARELKEEFDEVGLTLLADKVDDLEYTVCPVRATKIFKADGLLQYRLFYVVDIGGPAAPGFLNALRASTGSEGITFASAEEIKRGEHAGMPIGAHAPLLIPGERYDYKRTMPAYQ